MDGSAQAAMTASERDALAAIMLLAAFADGQPDDRERERIREAMARANGEEGVSNAVYQRVIFRQTDAAREAAALSSPEHRRLAYDMALSVCAADGQTTTAEREYLGGLAQALGISPESAREEVGQVDLLAGAPVAAGSACPPPLPTPGQAPPAQTSADAAASVERDRQIEASIQNYAILNGALELLPHGLASAAIIPLQMKMVYEIGCRYGYTLDSGHIKDFLATAGVGMTSQIVESFASRLGGRLLGVAGGMVFGRPVGWMMSGVGSRAAGAAVGFATTWALGHVARQYYAGGRTLSAIDLKALYTRQVASAQQAYAQWRPQVEQRARSLNPMQVLNMARGAA